jgi:hypothetical protein
MIFANPVGGYALENPLQGMEVASATLAATAGFLLSDLVDRFIATTALATSVGGQGVESGVNMRLVNAPPGMWRILAGLGMSLGPFALTPLAKNSPMVRATLQGAGLGAGVRFLVQMVKTFAIAKMTTNATVGRLYQDTLNSAATSTADLAMQNAAKAGTPPLPWNGMAGIPNYGQLGGYRSAYPHAGVGASMMLNTAAAYGGDVSQGTPPPGSALPAGAPSGGILVSTLTPTPPPAPVLSPTLPGGTPTLTQTIQQMVDGGTYNPPYSSAPPSGDMPPPIFPPPTYNPPTPPPGFPYSSQPAQQSFQDAVDSAKCNSRLGIGSLPSIDQMFPGSGESN